MSGDNRLQVGLAPKRHLYARNGRPVNSLFRAAPCISDKSVSRRVAVATTAPPSRVRAREGGAC
jgi:hypothetical protein